MVGGIALGSSNIPDQRKATRAANMARRAAKRDERLRKAALVAKRKQIKGKTPMANKQKKKALEKVTLQWWYGSRRMFPTDSTTNISPQTQQQSNNVLPSLGSSDICLLSSTPAVVHVSDDSGEENELLANISLVDDESEDDEVVLLQTEKKRGRRHKLQASWWLQHYRNNIIDIENSRQFGRHNLHGLKKYW